MQHQRTALSPEQTERLETLRDQHPATRFELLGVCEFSRAALIEWDEIGRGGQLLVTANGHAFIPADQR